MNKTELINVMAKASGVSKASAARALEALIKAVGDTLRKGGKVAIPGFGSFVVGNRKKRTGRNPRTGETIVIAAAKLPRFKAGKGLKEKVNK